MSGEGGGIIVGGLIMMAILPVVVGGAAVAATAYGAYHLVRAGYRAAKRSNERKQLRVEQCSAGLSRMYDELNQRMQEQRQVENSLREKALKRIEAAARDLETFRESKPSTEQMIRRTAAFREEMQRVFQDERQQELTLIREKSSRDMQELISAAQRFSESNSAAVQWEQKTEAAKNMQRIYAEGLLRDAEASVRLASGMKGQYPGSSFDREVSVLETSLAAAKQSFESGMFQSSCAQAQAIVSNCARTLIEHEQSAMEIMEMQADLQALAEALEAEVKERRTVTFDLPDLRTKKTRSVTEDLDDFSQGELEKLQNSIRSLTESLRSVSVSRGELMKLRRQYDVLRKNADTILTRSAQELVKHYDRMSALEVVADAMKEQNYTVDWALPEGDDPTQKLVVHFTNKVTGNTVSVTLDQDMDSRDVRRLTMEILFYYDSGAPVPEAEKKRIRKYLDSKLNEAGFMADVAHCTGAIDQSCPDRTYADEEAVMNQTPRRIYRRS